MYVSGLMLHQHHEPKTGKNSGHTFTFNYATNHLPIGSSLGATGG